MPDIHLRKYGTATKIPFVLWEADATDLKSDATFADGDVTVMIDEGAESATSTHSGTPQFHTLITDEGKGYSISLYDEDLTGARIVIYIVDQGAKAWLDKTIIIETYGHPLAQLQSYINGCF